MNTPPAPDENNLIWIDLEMTGLRPEKDRIIEIAVIVTNSNLEVLATGPVLAVRQPEELLAGMDEWNTTHHTASGLVRRVRESTIDEAEAEARTLEFLARHVPAGVSPMCGNSICQDRRFLYRYMPKLEAYFHYRNLDVSTLKILAMRWMPGLAEGFDKEEKHRALDDILESIGELRYYREHFLRPGL